MSSRARGCGGSSSSATPTTSVENAKKPISRFSSKPQSARRTPSVRGVVNASACHIALSGDGVINPSKHAPTTLPSAFGSCLRIVTLRFSCVRQVIFEAMGSVASSHIPLPQALAMLPASEAAVDAAVAARDSEARHGQNQASTFVPHFSLDLSAYVACSNAFALYMLLRLQRPAACPPTLPLRSRTLYASSASARFRPLHINARARVRVHSSALALTFILRLLHSTRTIRNDRMRAFARSVLRRLSGNGCCIVQVYASHHNSLIRPNQLTFSQDAAADFVSRQPVASDLRRAIVNGDACSCCAHLHLSKFEDIEERDPNR